MRRIGELIDDDSPRWGAALARVWHQVYQQPEYVAFDAQLVGGRACAYLYEEDNSVMLLPLVIRDIPGTQRRDATSPYGYPGPVANSYDPEFWGRACAELLRTLQDQRLVSLFLRLDPLSPAPLGSLSSIGTLVAHGSTVSIDLRLSQEQWWREIRKNHRDAINRSKRLGRTAVIDDWSYLDDFAVLYEETMTRLDADSSYHFQRDYFARLHTVLSDDIHLLMILADDEAIAGCLLLTGGGVMQYHLAGASTEFQLKEKTPRFVVHEAAAWGRTRGYGTFHLGGGVGGREDSLFYFKRGFSPHRPTFYTLGVVVDDEAYAGLLNGRQSGADAVDVDGYFPLYRTMSPFNTTGV